MNVEDEKFGECSEEEILSRKRIEKEQLKRRKRKRKRKKRIK